MLLYDQALLAENVKLSDPNEFINRLNRALEKSTKNVDITGGTKTLFRTMAGRGRPWPDSPKHASIHALDPRSSPPGLVLDC